jgi:phospholipase A1/A2
MSPRRQAPAPLDHGLATRMWIVLGLISPCLPAAGATPDAPACADIAIDADRLTCYDRQAGRSGMAALPSAAMPAASGAGHSLLSTYWELDAADKRGTFNYTGYQPNFFLPWQVSSRLNQAPSSPTRGVAIGLPRYQHVESKLQLSLRTKVAQNLLLPGGDLWVAYTQQSLWQMWNGHESAPLRVTNYQPELIFAAPTPASLQGPWLGWSWRLSQLGLQHESNGQSGALSRSWSRAYVLAGIERGDVVATWRIEQRLDGFEATAKDDNPDIVHFLGRSQVQLGWTPGLSTASLTWRPSLAGKGSVQLDWTYPLDRSKADGMRGYVQLFHGHGATILDYNFRQTTLGLGLSLIKF